MSITRDVRETLWSEWKDVSTDKNKKILIGQIFFRKLFTAHPEFIKLFKKFDGMNSLDEIINSTELKAHGLRVVNALNGVFETLDNEGELGDMLKHIGSSHKVRNVTCEHFVATVPVLQEVLLNYFKSEKVKVSVKNILTVAAPIILEGCKE